MPVGRLFLELYRLSWGIAALVRLIELQSTWELKEHVDWVKAGGAILCAPHTVCFCLLPKSAVSVSAWSLEDRNAGELRRTAAAEL